MIEYISAIASILTAVIAAVAWGVFKWDALRKKRRLEVYLKNEKGKAPPNSNGVPLLRIMADVGLTESEILHASFNSRVIRRKLTANGPVHPAVDLLFEYCPAGAFN